jgi:hypothetical protein
MLRLYKNIQKKNHHEKIMGTVEDDVHYRHRRQEKRVYFLQ